MGLAALVVALGGGLVLLALRLRVASAARWAARAAYLDHVAPGLADLRRAVAPTGFARLSGRVAGVTVDLQAVPDTLTYRKLPALWLLVTLPGPLPVQRTLDLMIRPMGVEPFSHFDTLPHQIALPPGFPADAALRSDGPLDLAGADLLRRHLGLFRDARVKELVLSPKGLRITWLADEADRSRYLIFRESELGQQPLPPEALAPLLARALAIRRDILGADQGAGLQSCA